MEERSWPEWLRSGRMFTTDMHMYDTTREHVDIRGITRTMAVAQCNIHRLSALTFPGWIFFNSTSGRAPKAPGLVEQDCLAEACEEGAKYGIHILAYFNQLGYREDHPAFGQFDLVDERGRPVVIYNVVRAACINSPWRELVLALMGEVFERYGPAGSYLDGGIRRCWCRHCRAAFRQYAGAELPSERALAETGIPSQFSWPEALDAIEDPLLRAYAAWQQQVRDDFYRDVRRVVQQAKPDAVTLFHLFPGQREQHWYDGTLIEGGERSRPAELWQTQERAQAARHYRVPVFVNVFYNRGAPAEELRHRAYQVLASGCYPNVINAPNADYRALPGIAEANRLLAQHPDIYDFAATRPVPLVLLPREPWEAIRHRAVRRAHPLGFPGEDAPPGEVDEIGNPVLRESRAFPASHVHRFLSATQGMAGALLLSGIPTTSILPEALAAELSRTAGGKGRPRVLCLANEAALSDAEVVAIRAYVEGGGGLVATFETSLYDERGRRRDDFALADLFGVHLAGERAIGGLGVYEYHLVPGAPHPVNGGLLPSARLPYPELVLPVRAEAGTTVLAGVTRPPVNHYPPTGDHIGRLRDSLMAGDDTGYPFAVARAFGKGRVVYFAGRPDSAYLHWALPEMRQWLANAVRWAAGATLPVEVQALAPVAVSLFEQPGRWIIHLLNYAGSLTTPLEFAPPPLAAVELHLRPPGGAAVLGVRRIAGTHAPTVRYGANGVTITLPRLDLYDALVVELGGPPA